MATYREIKGLKVPYLDADPPTAVADTEAGSIWYNSATGKLRAFIAADTWSTSAPIGTGRGQTAGAGTQTAGLIFGGDLGAKSVLTEEYNGSGWAGGGDLNTAKDSHGGLGIQTAALSVAGLAPGAADIVESYDGSSWTEIADINTARGGVAATGTTTAGLVLGGSVPGNPESALTESWNGTAWTETGDLNDAREVYQNSCGTSTATLCIAGYSPPQVAVVEEFNGASWTEVGDVNTARYGNGASGTTSFAVTFGGIPATANTELYDGTSWTETSNLSATNTYMASSVTTAASAFSAGGGTGPAPAAVSTTEEFSHSMLVYTPASFSTGGVLNQGRHQLGGSNCGTVTAALIGGGRTTAPAFVVLSEEYNGTTWTE